MAKQYATADEVLEHLGKDHQISLYNAKLLGIEIYRLRRQLTSNQCFDGWKPNPAEQARTPSDDVGRMREAAFILAQAAGALNVATDGMEKLRPEREAVLSALKVLAALSPAMPKGGERYRHVKRGGTYEVIANAELQDATGVAIEGATLVIYRGEDGKVWARQEDEFHDGRFEVIPPPPAKEPQP